MFDPVQPQALGTPFTNRSLVALTSSTGAPGSWDSSRGSSRPVTLMAGQAVVLELAQCTSGRTPGFAQVSRRGSHEIRCVRASGCP